MPSKEDYKAMHDDAVHLMEIGKRMSRFSAEFLALSDEGAEKIEEAADEAFGNPMMESTEDNEDGPDKSKRIKVLKLKASK